MMKKSTSKKRFLWLLQDIVTMTRRNVLRYFRLPQLLIFATIQPVMFVLLFAYVFGGAISIPGISYINYLLPGILVQSVMFGATQTGVGLADDVSRGMIERFRSLPMARSAVLAGRTIADMFRNVFVISLMTGVGTIIGFRFQQGIVEALLAFVLAILFGFAFSWISAAIGLAVKSAETAQVASFVWTFPLVFASSVFVPIKTMPAGLQAFAKISPVTVTVNAIRALTLGGDYKLPYFQSLIWITGILMVFIPLAVYLYRKN